MASEDLTLEAKIAECCEWERGRNQCEMGSESYNCVFTLGPRDREDAYVILQKENFNVVSATSCTASVTIFKTSRYQERRIFGKKYLAAY